MQSAIVPRHPPRAWRVDSWLVALCTGLGCTAVLADADVLAMAATSAAAVSSNAAPQIELSATAPSSALYPQGEGPRGPGKDNLNATRLEISSWTRPVHESGVGLTLGVDTPRSPWADGRNGNGNGNISTVDLGVRWRSAPVNQRRIDIAAFRQVNYPQDAYSMLNSAGLPMYSARVEMQFQSARFGGLTPELGAIGMQLNSGGKVVLRTKRGGPMLYYRAKF